MKCIQCGAEIKDGSNFCSKCGAKQTIDRTREKLISERNAWKSKVKNLEKQGELTPSMKMKNRKLERQQAIGRNMDEMIQKPQSWTTSGGATGKIVRQITGGSTYSNQVNNSMQNYLTQIVFTREMVVTGIIGVLVVISFFLPWISTIAGGKNTFGLASMIDWYVNLSEEFSGTSDGTSSMFVAKFLLYLSALIPIGYIVRIGYKVLKQTNFVAAPTFSIIYSAVYCFMLISMHQSEDWQMIESFGDVKMGAGPIFIIILGIADLVYDNYCRTHKEETLAMGTQAREIEIPVININRTISIRAIAVRVREGSTTKLSIEMTTYGQKAPKAMLGTLELFDCFHENMRIEDIRISNLRSSANHLISEEIEIEHNKVQWLQIEAARFFVTKIIDAEGAEERVVDVSEDTKISPQEYRMKKAANADFFDKLTCEQESGTWHCICGTVNLLKDTHCDMCGYIRKETN